jgi:hypothetical protein
MLFTNMLVIKHQLNHGELVVLLPVFLVLEEVVRTDQVRVLSVTCAVEVECLHQLKHGEDGTVQSTKSKEGLLFAPH